MILDYSYCRWCNIFFKNHHYFLNKNFKFSLYSAVQILGLQLVQAHYLKKLVLFQRWAAESCTKSQAGYERTSGAQQPVLALAPKIYFSKSAQLNLILEVCHQLWCLEAVS